MKKLFAFGAFALVSLVATSAHAQSTISPVPGAKDAPHETSPSNIPSQDPYGNMKSADQRMPNKSTYTGTMKHGKHSGKNKMKSKAVPSTGSM